jgi:hypothetical protein
MNALTIVRFAPRREIQRGRGREAKLTCRWVRLRSGELVCRWTASSRASDEPPGPGLRLAA